MKELHKREETHRKVFSFIKFLNTAIDVIACASPVPLSNKNKWIGSEQMSAVLPKPFIGFVKILQNRF